MDAKSIFAIRLKALREGAGLSQEGLAREIGVSRGSISFYENGDRTADIDTLSKIAGYFKKSADYLIGLKDKEKIEKYFDELNMSQIEINSLALDLYSKINESFFTLQTYYYNHYGLENDGDGDPIVPKMTKIIYDHLSWVIGDYDEMASRLFEQGIEKTIRDYLISTKHHNAHSEIVTELMRLGELYDYDDE